MTKCDICGKPPPKDREGCTRLYTLKDGEKYCINCLRTLCCEQRTLEIIKMMGDQMYPTETRGATFYNDALRDMIERIQQKYSLSEE